jgi:T1SS-143 domain-containing protein
MNGMVLATDEASGLSGSLAALVSFGGDGPGEFAMLTDTSELPTLFSKGEQVQYIVEGNTLIAFVGEYGSGSGDEAYKVSMVEDGGYRVVFTLQINPDGPGTSTCQDQLDHVDDGTDSENFELLTGFGEEGAIGIPAIDFSSLLKVTDGDGDVLTGAPAGSFTIEIQDDVPVAVGQPISVTVDEDDIKTWLSLGNHPNDGNEDGSYTGNPYFSGPGPANVSGSVASLVSFGADEHGTFSLSTDLGGLEEQGLFSKGEALSYRVEGATLIAFVGEEQDDDVLVATMDYMPSERVVFTLELDADGSYTFRLFDQLDHAEGEGENNLPIDLSSVIVATDADGDSITLESGFTVNVTDDVPEEAGVLPEFKVVEDEALPNGNQEFGDIWPDTTVAKGWLTGQVSFGADENGTFSLVEEPEGLPSLTSGSVPVTYQVEGNVLTAMAG